MSPIRNTGMNGEDLASSAYSANSAILAFLQPRFEPLRTGRWREPNVAFRYPMNWIM